jgi:hypothetical protein
MPTYTNNTFQGRKSLGTAAIVRADSPAQAAAILNDHLKACRFKGRVTSDKMVKWPMSKEILRILNDGSC